MTLHSDTSANEDHSFRNHIRQPKRDFPQVSTQNRLIRSGYYPLFNDKFYKIVKKHTIKGQKLTKGSDEKLPNLMEENGKQNEKLTIFTLLYVLKIYYTLCTIKLKICTQRFYYSSSKFSKSIHGKSPLLQQLASVSLLKEK